MTTVTAPTLGGTSLPIPAKDGYLENIEWRGGFSEMASGSLQRDLLSSTGKKVFELTWVSITITEAETIATAYGAVVSTDATFVSPFGDSCDVQPGDSQPIQIRYIPTAGDVVADVTIRLREA